MTAISLNCWTETDQKAVREQLDRLLQSGPFAQSRRRQRFLDYIVTETLAGRGERLKGYNIGLEVFDRPDTFDPAIDPIVRIEAARLRDKLREYYEADGQGDPIRIDLPKGSYTPHIEFRHPGVVEAAQDRPGENRRREQTPLRWQIALPVLALLLVLGGAWLARDRWLPRHRNSYGRGLPRSRCAERARRSRSCPSPI